MPNSKKFDYLPPPAAVEGRRTDASAEEASVWCLPLSHWWGALALGGTAVIRPAACGSKVRPFWRWRCNSGHHRRSERHHRPRYHCGRPPPGQRGSCRWCHRATKGPLHTAEHTEDRSVIAIRHGKAQLGGIGLVFSGAGRQGIIEDLAASSRVGPASTALKLARRPRVPALLSCAAGKLPLRVVTSWPSGLRGGGAGLFPASHRCRAGRAINVWPRWAIPAGRQCGYRGHIRFRCPTSVNRVPVFPCVAALSR